MAAGGKLSLFPREEENHREACAEACVCRAQVQVGETLAILRQEHSERGGEKKRKGHVFLRQKALHPCCWNFKCLHLVIQQTKLSVKHR